MATPNTDPTLIAFLEGVGANYWTNQFVHRYYLSTIRAFEIAGGKITYFEGLAETWLPEVGQMEPFEQNLLEAVYFDLLKCAWFIKGNLDYPELIDALTRATEKATGQSFPQPTGTKVKVRKIADSEAIAEPVVEPAAVKVMTFEQGVANIHIGAGFDPNSGGGKLKDIEFPEELWMRWAQARSVETRLVVAHSKKAPLSVINFLTGNKNPKVREGATKNLAKRLAKGEFLPE